MKDAQGIGMSCVPGFEFDIFISYSWNDNHVAGDAPGWVDTFHERLESWLKHRRGRAALSVWRDREQTGNTVFDLAIENKIKSSALFFAFNSRNFLKSAYCAKELGLFQRYHGDRPGGPLVGEQSRIINILLDNIPHQKWPAGLGRTSGFLRAMLLKHPTDALTESNIQRKMRIGDVTLSPNECQLLQLKSCFA